MKTKGFTLLECLITISLTALLFSSVLPTLFTLYSHNARASKIRLRLQESEFITQRLAREIRCATKVFNDSDLAILHLQDNSYPPVELWYSLVNKRVREKRGGAYLYLTDNLDISRLEFSYSKSTVTILFQYADGEVFHRKYLIRSVT